MPKNVLSFESDFRQTGKICFQPVSPTVHAVRIKYIRYTVFFPTCFATPGVPSSGSLYVGTSSAVRSQHIFYCSAENRYVLQFSNVTCTKRAGIMLRIFTSNIATLNGVLHRLFIISFIYVNYVLCVRLGFVKSGLLECPTALRVAGMSNRPQGCWNVQQPLGLLECPTALLHLVTIHQPRAFRRKMKL